MRFLIDYSLSPDLASLLTASGYESFHVRDALSARAKDEAIFEFAARSPSSLSRKMSISAPSSPGDALPGRRSCSSARGAG